MAKYFFDSKTGKMKLRTSRLDGKRSYSSVISDQFQEGWTAPLTNAHSELRGGAIRLRNMARDLERSNSYAVRFLNEWTTNIIGTGFTFQSLATNAQGREDILARQIIEERWLDWKKARNCTASADMPYNEFKALSERACARDGGVLIQKIKGYDGNDYNFALNILEIDRLDHDYNTKANRLGNRVIMGLTSTAAQLLTIYLVNILATLITEQAGKEPGCRLTRLFTAITESARKAYTVKV